SYLRMRSPLLGLWLLIAASSHAQPPAVSTATAAGPALKLVADADLPKLQETFKGRNSLIKAAKKAIAYLKTLPPTKTVRIADRDYGPAALIDSAQTLIDIAGSAKSQEELDARVRAAFDVFQSAGTDGYGRVIFSSYFEPVLKARLKKSGAYAFPL